MNVNFIKENPTVVKPLIAVAVLIAAKLGWDLDSDEVLNYVILVSPFVIGWIRSSVIPMAKADNHKAIIKKDAVAATFRLENGTLEYWWRDANQIAKPDKSNEMDLIP